MQALLDGSIVNLSITFLREVCLKLFSSLLFPWPNVLIDLVKWTWFGALVTKPLSQMNINRSK